MSNALRFLLQVVFYVALAWVLGRFAASPNFEYADRTQASIKLSLSHAADRVKPCVPLTEEQIAELAANMRRTEACERERLPVVVELDIDGQSIVSLTAPPSGLWNDGPASIYERFDISPGAHRITVRLRDTARTDGWDYEKTDEVMLEPGRYFTVTFKPATGGFNFR